MRVNIVFKYPNNSLNVTTMTRNIIQFVILNSIYNQSVKCYDDEYSIKIVHNNVNITVRIALCYETDAKKLAAYLNSTLKKDVIDGYQKEGDILIAPKITIKLDSNVIATNVISTTTATITEIPGSSRNNTVVIVFIVIICLLILCIAGLLYLYRNSIISKLEDGLEQERKLTLEIERQNVVKTEFVDNDNDGTHTSEKNSSNITHISEPGSDMNDEDEEDDIKTNMETDIMNYDNDNENEDLYNDNVVNNQETPLTPKETPQQQVDPGDV